MDNELIELLEFAKSQKIACVEYEGQQYHTKNYKFKKYYAIYDKNDFYIDEIDDLEILQDFFQFENKYTISSMIAQHNLVRDKYYIYRIYEILI